MQKKHLNKARRAKTGMTGNTGKTGTQGTAGKADTTTRHDPLTQAQRRLKRLRDKKYRARKRAAARAALAQGRPVSVAEVDMSAAPASSAKAGHPHETRHGRCRKCGRCGKGVGPAEVTADRRDPNSPCADVPQGSAVVPPRAADAQDVFSLVGRIVLGELAKSGVPSASPTCTRPVQVERGVVRQEMSLPDGRTAVVTLVDGDEVDPLSPNSPVPWPIRRHLLLRRMAREISDIVDSHLECS